MRAMTAPMTDKADALAGHTAVYSNCAKCGQIVRNPSLLVGDRIYHPECSPYQQAKLSPGQAFDWAYWKNRAEDAEKAFTATQEQLERCRAETLEEAAKWHDKNARLCLEASKDDPRLNADDRRRAFDAHRHHAASAASLRLKLSDERRAAIRAIEVKP